MHIGNQGGMLNVAEEKTGEAGGRGDGSLVEVVEERVHVVKIEGWCCDDVMIVLDRDIRLRQCKRWWHR